MMKFKLKIEIIGNKVSVSLFNKEGGILSKLDWTDQRDLSEKLLRKINLLLQKNKLVMKNIERVDFNCDSPYFKKKYETISLNDDFSSKGKCGFTTWQVGEIVIKTLNFVLDES